MLKNEIITNVKSSNVKFLTAKIGNVYDKNSDALFVRRMRRLLLC